MPRILILGTGPAGYTAALYLARARLSPVVVEGKEPGGQLTTTTDVENFPGFPDGIQGPELMERMRRQAEYFGAEIRTGSATAVDVSQNPFQVTLGGKEKLSVDALIISTGASAKLLGIPGEKEYMGRGVSTCATCDGFFFRNRNVIVIGGGDSAMEEAVYLTKFATRVTVVHRRNELRASMIMQERAREHSKIDWALSCTPLRILAQKGRVVGLRVHNANEGREETLSTDGVFIAIGHCPNTRFLRGQVKQTEQGYIVVRPGTTRTSVPFVFACGDVQDSTYRQAITAAGSGCMAAIDCERFLAGNTAQDW
ncbi:thioredoxin-disulfide reductase [Pasteuria penetrans]|uniref:thioredoxin-disulfide reductase n=1 Tax=Pasteuria penetrans TaxID=86005 RepID=UPI0011EDC68B|nr:thioredoxin-disulfide reductase [Pasteuria penetrans]